MEKPTSIGISRQTAFQFIILLGIISFFSDIADEGARSITGPFLALLGASGAVVGFIAGFGELLGNVLRVASGYWVDKTSKYWFITFLGYFINLISLPLLAFAGTWQAAAVLILLERIGKAIRVPA